MGASSYVSPPPPFSSLNNCNTVINRFGLTPNQTKHLNAFFHQFAGRDRRLTPREFRKMYSKLYPGLNRNQSKAAAYTLFLQMDTNRDGMISFDEFVDAYACYPAFKANQTLPCPSVPCESGLIPNCIYPNCAKQKRRARSRKASC
jgi:hypothetical protein